MRDSDVVFIAVGTPSREDGSIDLSQMESACVSLGEQLKETKKFVTVVVKSTVIPGTTKNFVGPILEKTSEKKVGKDFGLGMNPEFLREGTAIYDFLNPDKIVVGINDSKTKEVLEKLYSWTDKVPIIFTNTNTAEMIKYAQNSMLASRISFMNEVANICEKFDVDVKEVAHAIGLDSRIGPKFLNAGIGFGGSCFPKDVKALIATAKSVGVEPKLLEATIEINEKQPHRIVDLAKRAIGDLRGKKISVLGLAFKPDTDDMREARSIPIIQSLVEHGAVIKAYDPYSAENAKTIFGNSIKYSKSKEECIKDADIVMILTEWDEFKNIDLEKINVPIIDGRRIVDKQKALELGTRYKGIGWSGNFG